MLSAMPMEDGRPAVRRCATPSVPPFTATVPENALISASRFTVPLSMETPSSTR